MAHFSGLNLAVYWGAAEAAAIDLTGHGRTVDLTETAPAPESIDVTHKADTARVILEGFPGAPETNVSFTALVDDTWALVNTMPLNTQSTLWIFPQGRVAGEHLIKVAPARLHERSYSEVYDGTMEMTMTFNSKAVCTHTTAA